MAQSPSPAVVTVTGAAGSIGYAALFRIAAGEMLGPDTPIRLRLLEIPSAVSAAEGTAMELDDSAFPCSATSRSTTTRSGASTAPTWLSSSDHVPGPRAWSAATSWPRTGRSSPCRVGPSTRLPRTESGCWSWATPPTQTRWSPRTTPRRPRGPVHGADPARPQPRDRPAGTALRRRGEGHQPRRDLGQPLSTQYPDIFHARVGDRSGAEFAADREWLTGDFIPTVANRGSAIIEARGASSAASAANAAIDHVHDWVLGTPEDDWTSVALPSPAPTACRRVW